MKDRLAPTRSAHRLAVEVGSRPPLPRGRLLRRVAVASGSADIAASLTSSPTSASAQQRGPRGHRSCALSRRGLATGASSSGRRLGELPRPPPRLHLRCEVDPGCHLLLHREVTLTHRSAARRLSAPSSARPPPIRRDRAGRSMPASARRPAECPLPQPRGAAASCRRGSAASAAAHTLRSAGAAGRLCRPSWTLSGPA